MGSAYANWNAALGEHFFGEQRQGELVALAVDDEVILHVAQQFEISAQDSSTEAAVYDFAKAVREEVQARGWNPGKTTPGLLPDCIAKCCLLVLACSRTESAGIGRPPFWRQVNKLLESKIEDRSLGPFGLTGETFQKLWREGVQRWVNEYERGRWGRIELPPERLAFSRHVRLIQS